jgi:hypothetical protein
MKHTVLAVAFAASLAAAPALAGGYAEPVMEPAVIAEAVTADHTWVGVLMTLLVFGAALGS